MTVNTPPAGDVTDLLLAWSNGDRAALDRLMPLVYAELHRIAHRHIGGESPHHLLQSTALVHEAYLRLVDQSRTRWQNRTHFFAVSATLMRRVLVDLARARGARKRGGAAFHVSLDEVPEAAPLPGPDLVALDEALTALAALDGRKARVVELRYFGGLSVEETAGVLRVSADTVTRDWQFARLWLSRELGRSGGSEEEPRR